MTLPLFVQLIHSVQFETHLHLWLTENNAIEQFVDWFILCKYYDLHATWVMFIKDFYMCYYVRLQLMVSLWALLLESIRNCSSLYVHGSDYFRFLLQYTLVSFLGLLFPRRDNAVSETALRIVASMKRDWMQAGVPYYIFLPYIFHKAVISLLP